MRPVQALGQHPHAAGLTRLADTPWPDAYLKAVPRQSGAGGLFTTQADMLALLKKQQTNEGQGTIVPVLSSETALGLPERSLDLAILVDVYHELLYPVEVMTSLAASMKPGGQIVLIEYRAEDPAVPIKTLHKMSEAQIKKEAALLGLVWVKTIAVLPWQHLVILKK